MISRALKTIRLYHNLKQSELAENFCISKSYLSEIESGKKTVSFDMLEKYSKEFNIPVSSLVFFSEELESPSKKTVAEKFRSVFADKILKIMEWSIERNAGKEDKEIKDKD
ncbi:helix-turn-helix domain-containing protein [Serratia fonticola]|uniref:helix-turn-helix domain-containing protein n=1 Tax=Serratia fonticola TaxID=47917 RepID=UPI003AFF6908